MESYPSTYKNGNRKAIIKFNEDWEEYQVWFYVDNKFQKDATYHTDDLDDAASTASRMVESITA